MKLIGSAMSPYVRRIRLLLDGHDYDFIDLNIYSPEGREALSTYTPTMKIPVLIDNKQTIYDSRIIHRYLNEKQKGTALSWDQENLLTLIDAANDSFVVLLLSTRSNINTDADLLITNLQKERIERTLPILEQAVADGQFSAWDYSSICLFCLLDWVHFRELSNLAQYPHLSDFRTNKLEFDGVAESDPRAVNA
ncbi:glutathione S-transferase family protein [Neptunomonas antarctica]|uniref:Glutathione S-transferase n=1 Tax=Neptunomonas antarctica TaxID=619304 RepID=A0A1N7J4X8_9GAMM|nr:glutathione S-transferase N-terminal domain-containing protein [Neptunomonas antarctica]SIS44415.1 glutathione S-transferase [Neptunomonas antarctica]